MPLSPGDKLGSYEIISQIGTGGMGEVYRARDTRLGRDVALRLPSHVFLIDGSEAMCYHPSNLANSYVLSPMD